MFPTHPIALMIGDNCYAGDCTSPELCAAVPVPEGSLQRSQIAYITAPGRTKAEDKTALSGMNTRLFSRLAIPPQRI